MLNYKNTFYILLICITSVLFFFYNTLPIGGRLNNDDLRNTYAPELIKQQQSYVLTDTYNEIFNTYGFIPPGHYINKDKKIFVNGSFGSPLVFSTPYVIIDNIIFSNLIQVLTYCFIWIFSFLIIRKYTLSNTLSFIGSTFIVYAPILLSNLNVFYPDLTSLLILSAAFYTLIKGFDKDQSKFKYLSVFLFSFSVLFKINNIIILAPVFLYLLIKKRLTIRLIITSIGIFIVTMFPQFYFNKVTMGTYTEFSYTSYSNVYDGQFTASSEDKKELYDDVDNVFLYRLINEYLIPQETDKGYSLLLNIKVIFLSIPLLSPILLLLFLRKKKDDYFIITLYIFLFSFLFYGNLGGGFGIGEINIRSSFFRYLLFPLYLLSIFSVVYLLQKCKTHNHYILIFSLGLLISFINIVTIYPFNNYTFGKFKDTFYTAGKNISNIVPEGSIILTSGFDDGFLTQPKNNYHIFDYGYIPKPLQDTEILNIITKSRELRIPIYLYYINLESKSWGNNHLYDFSGKYSIDEVYKFGKYYYIYKITGTKNENSDTPGL